MENKERIPAVQELVHRITGRLPFKGINPDECVAMGACLQGGVLSVRYSDEGVTLHGSAELVFVAFF